MSEMRKLTDFQKTCEATLLQTLEEFGFEQTNRAQKTMPPTIFDDREEDFITFLVGSTNIEIFIYEDGAEINTSKPEVRLERLDCDSLSELIETCNKVLRRLLAAIR